MELTYGALENLCKEYEEIHYVDENGNKKEYGKAVLIGSWALPAYNFILKGIKTKDMERFTEDIDFYIIDEETINAINLMCDESIMYNECFQPYRPISTDNNAKFEFFINCPFDDTISKKLFDYMKKEKELLDLPLSEKIKVPKPWLWLGMKLIAWEKSKKEKHRHDIIYFKGLVGDEKFKEYLNELTSKDKDFVMFREIYASALMPEFQSQTTLENYVET